MTEGEGKSWEKNHLGPNPGHDGKEIKCKIVQIHHGTTHLQILFLLGSASDNVFGLQMDL